MLVYPFWRPTTCLRGHRARRAVQPRAFQLVAAWGQTKKLISLTPARALDEALPSSPRQLGIQSGYDRGRAIASHMCLL